MRTRHMVSVSLLIPLVATATHTGASNSRLPVTPYPAVQLQDTLHAHYHVSAQPSWSPDGTQIAFSSLRDDHPTHYEIYVINADGSDPRRITFGTVDAVGPSWSPDGRTIVFGSRRTGVHQLYTVGLTGSGERRLTDSEAGATYPTWSPDGRYIVFNSSLLEVGRREVLRVDADGSNLAFLTNTMNRNDWGSYSPDGKALVFESNRSGIWEVYLADTDGSRVRKLSRDEAGAPRWSPDGQSILVHARRPNTNSTALFRLNLDGSEEPLFDSGGDDRLPVPSPDGRLVAFISNPHGPTDLFLLDVQTGYSRRLTHQPEGEFFTILRTEGLKGAARIVEVAGARGLLDRHFREYDMRRMAGRYDLEGWTEAAVQLYRWNTLAYPSSTQAWRDLEASCKRLGRMSCADSAAAQAQRPD